MAEKSRATVKKRTRSAAASGRGKFIAVASLLLFVVFQAFVYHFYFALPLSINDQPRQAFKGETIGKLLARKGIALQRGDLISVSGKVLQRGGGKPPLIEVNQKRTALDRVLKNSDSLFISNGTDVQERKIRLLEPLPQPTLQEDEGPFITLVTHGYPGLKMIQKGEFSQEIASEEIIRPPQPAIIRRSTNVPSLVVALTFDDGPDPIFTPQILSVLQREGALATFFVLGKKAQEYPEIVQQLIASGNALGNHSFSHPDLGQASRANIEHELATTERILTDIAGHNTKWFRPPKGSLSPLLISTAALMGYRLVLWDIDPWDWSKPGAETIYQRVATKVRPGAVILLHDGGGDRTQTVAALPKIIALLRSQGYYFVTLDQLPND